MMDKSVPRAGEAEWLEVHEAAALLAAARRYKHRRDRRPSIPRIYPIIATYLLTGGREKEVLGLEARARQLRSDDGHVPAERAPAAQDGDGAPDGPALAAA
jgi:integrase